MGGLRGLLALCGETKKGRLAWPAYNSGVTTPTEIKAQAVALVVIGRSCREVQEVLRQQFPDAHIPHFSTIARWARATPPTGGVALMRWWGVLDRAGQTVDGHLISGRVTPMEALEIASKGTDIVLALRRSLPR